MKTITFITQNLHKVQDAQKLLPNFLIEHINFEVPEIQSLDLQEIVKHKIQYAYDNVKKPCFVMDTALYMDALNGFPGPFIKWYFEKTVGEEKTCQIANLFNQHGVQITTVLGYYNGITTIFLEETVTGLIPSEPRGTNGYHWDTIFIPKGDDRTFAEMTFEEKQSFAVTKKLFERFKSLL